MSLTLTTLTGTISSVENHGTIVTVWLKTKLGQEYPVHFDHRPFQHLLEAENCTAEALVGHRASFSDGTLSFRD